MEEFKKSPKNSFEETRAEAQTIKDESCDFGELQNPEKKLEIIRKLSEENKKLSEENRELMEKIQELEESLEVAGVDRATGLMVGNLLKKKLNGIFESFSKEGDRREGSKFNKLGIVFFDLNNLKAINEKYDHQTGDDALRAISNAIQGQLRDFDFAGRWGGDEIILCLMEVDEEIAAKVGERINLVLQKTQVSSNYPDLRVSASIGVVSHHKKSEDINLEELVNRADQAANASKAIFREKGVVEIIKYGDLQMENHET